MFFCSANCANRELRMVQKTLEICLSETHASGNREVRTKDLSSQAILIPGARRQWKRNKGGHKKAHKNIRKVPFVALNNISATFKSTRTSRGMFARAISSVEVIKPRWRSCTRTSREDRWSRKKAENFNWDNHWRSGWRLSSWKSYENEFNIILQYKYHRWIFRTVLNEFWQIVDYQLRFIIARKGRKLW